MFIPHEVIRFIIVGFMNTFNYYVLYLLFFHLFGWHYMVSHVLAFIISMIGSFFMNSYFTYKTKPTWKKFFQFPLTYVVNITVTSTAIFLLVEVMKLNETISPLLASVIAIPFTFIISKKILVKDETKTS
ncbi:GtrA family protein [Bacillus salitolerans]|uniref:GtrA family protein n=1 Tax=Bacillus salitolerans TaxID=1437434 RepID=A0ABW4LRW2_9BACI